jgi:pyridinium-3,5-bisthiocarboxylic acid mononucleotide nickel chelatase
MTVGALLDLGVPQEHLLTNLNKLGISNEYEIVISKSLKSGIEGTQFDVVLRKDEQVDCITIYDDKHAHESHMPYVVEKIHEHHQYSQSDIIYGNHVQVHEHQQNLITEHIHVHNYEQENEKVQNQEQQNQHDSNHDVECVQHDNHEHQHGGKHEHEHENSHGYNHEHEHGEKHEHEHGEKHEHEHGDGNSEHQHDHVHGKHQHEGRNLFVIEGLIDKSKLNENTKKIAKDIFKRVAEAEAIVHGKSIYEVHFHEVGAVDSIVDIVGAAICIDYLKPDKIIASPINTGSGFVKCEHGMIPVPAPATMQILKDVPIYCDEREFELTTPTGAAIIKVLASEFKKLPSIRIKRVGYGCGKRDTEKPNLLRVVLAEDEFEEVCIFEATIDDMNPQIYSYFMDKLFSAGAKDVYLTPVYMKKNRPGIVATITATNKLEDAIKEIIFKETTTIGIRKFNIERTELERDFKSVETCYGAINFKISSYKDSVVNVTPEFEDIKSAAKDNNVPMKEVYSIANAAIRDYFLE